MDNSCCALISDSTGTGGPVALGLLFSAGVTISLGHCVGMCGPVVATVFGGGGATAAALPRMLTYHARRLTSYVLIGAAIGLVGSATRLAGSAPVVQGVVSIVAGALIVAMGLGMIGLIPHLSSLERTPLGMRAARAIQIFFTASFLIAHVFLAYFIPVDKLLIAMREGPSGHLTSFIWTTAMTGILYFDFAWFREQTCLIICPYGRTQSALIDADTLIIGDDERRGEPRSKKVEEGGDCIDCKRCVAVCPTGIDIRNGLQMECIGCANCIDACDDIMERIGRPEGLVRYDSRSPPVPV